jgi:diadenylate cyclase
MNSFLHFVPAMRWQDVVDITLNSYILFRLYVLFRGTNVFRVLVGMAFLWFFHRIALFLGLIVTSWVIQAITAVAALIIIVVFRNEIRSVLQVENLRAILWGFPHKTLSSPTEVIVDSVYELARRRSGALIVFPGKEDLEEIVQPGIKWRGLVSKEMIMSIFWYDNPVHDGAAIIQGNQVTQVGVILPLSNRRDLPSYYGTRHRAAAGLAENTDALVIVVSEERGSVLVAKGSNLSVVPRAEKLEQILREHVGVTTTHWSHLRKERLGLGIAVLGSVLFITAVWFSFTRGLETLTTFEIPIEYMNRDPRMEILDTSVNAVRLHLSGSGTLIKSMRPEQVRVRLDLSEAVVGPNTFSIRPENVDLPPGLLVKKVEPPVLEVTLDIPIRKEFPVQVDWVGKLPEDLVLVQAKLDPEKIEVIGGTQQLANISTLYTQKVPVDKIKKTGIMTVNLALHPPSLRIAPGSKEGVTVRYVAKERLQ